MDVAYRPVSEEEYKLYQNWLDTDCNIHLAVGFVRFVSRSKGRGRKRKGLLEVELYRYRGHGWHLPHKIRLDVVAQEIYSDNLEAMLEAVTRLCDRTGGE